MTDTAAINANANAAPTQAGGKRPRYKPGMVYAVPLADGTFGIAQAGAAMWPQVIYVALYADRLESLPTAAPPLSRANAVSLAATWKKQLNRGPWIPLGVANEVATLAEFPNETHKDQGYVGAKNHDAEILAEFLSAWHGLLPWNVMFDPAYYDELLAKDAPPSDKIRILDAAERAAYRESVFGVKAPPHPDAGSA